MTKAAQTTAFDPLDVSHIYAAAFGLFTPGALMAARLHATPRPNPIPKSGQNGLHHPLP